MSGLPVVCEVFETVDDQWQNLRVLPEHRKPGEGVGQNLGEANVVQSFLLNEGDLVLGVNLQIVNGLSISMAPPEFSYQVVSGEVPVVHVWRRWQERHHIPCFRNVRVVVIKAE